MMWRPSYTERGGGQGSRLMMTAFCCAIQVALETADKAMAAAIRQHPPAGAIGQHDAPAANDVIMPALDEVMAAAEPPREEAIPTVMTHGGYQDDQYFSGTLATFELYEPHMLRALQQDGHELQQQKCALWIPALDGVPTGHLPQRALDMWERYPRAEGGITALGASAEGDHETFIDKNGGIALQPVRERARKCMSLLAEIRAMVTAQLHPQTFHAAWLMLSGSCVHAFDYDARLVEADRLRGIVLPVYTELMEVVAEIAGGLSAEALARVKLQGPFGGCGLRLTALAPHAHAALWAAAHVNCDKINSTLGQLGAGTVAPDDAAAQSIADAAKALRDAGIDVDGDHPVLEASAREHFITSPWNEDRPIDDILQPRMPMRGDAAGRPKLAGAMFAALDALEAMRLWEQSPTEQQTVMLSAGGPGVGSMWSMRGLGERRALQNGHFREAMRMRLGVATAPHGATCQLSHKQHADGEPIACGKPLRDETGLCIHPLACDAAAARLRPHRATCTAVGRNLRAAGAEVDYERHVPHMYQWDATKQLYKEAILDVVSVWPGDSALRCYDITIASPHAARVNNPWRRPGVAARSGEARKATRYGNTVRPLSFEVYGRLGPRSLVCLREAAREASMYGRSDMSAKQLELRWRGDMELAMAYAQADAMLAARGALQHVAGPLYHPVGRMVRANAAAGGEHRERLVV